jgi:hypothetical protein
MSCERAEQPLSHSDLEDTRARAPMEIVMAGSPGDICLFCLHPVEPVLGTCGSSRAALSQKVGAGAQVTCGSPKLPQAGRREPRGHVAAPELP